MQELYKWAKDRNYMDAEGNPIKRMTDEECLHFMDTLEEEVTRIDRNSELKYSKVAEFNIGRFLLA